MVASLVRKKRIYRIELYDSEERCFILREVEGMPISITGFENIDFFYFKDEAPPSSYVLTVTKIGRHVCSAGKLKNIVANAIEAFERNQVCARDAEKAIEEYRQKRYGELDAQTCDLNSRMEGKYDYHD